MTAALPMPLKPCSLQLLRRKALMPVPDLLSGTFFVCCAEIFLLHKMILDCLAALCYDAGVRS
jgi:hypothetical protein